MKHLLASLLFFIALTYLGAGAVANDLHPGEILTPSGLKINLPTGWAVRSQGQNRQTPQAWFASIILTNSPTSHGQALAQTVLTEEPSTVFDFYDMLELPEDDLQIAIDYLAANFWAAFSDIYSRNTKGYLAPQPGARLIRHNQTAAILTLATERLNDLDLLNEVYIIIGPEWTLRLHARIPQVDGFQAISANTRQLLEAVLAGWEKSGL